MKLTLLILLAILPVVALATQPGQESTGGAKHESVSDNTQQQPTISAHTQDEATYDPIDPLPISKKKCLAVNKDGYCTQFESD